MNRREFLKLSAASVAGAGATAYISPASFAAAAGVDAASADGNYYDYLTTTTDESIAYAQEVTEEVMQEGATLLKNEGNLLPLAKGSKVTLFGTRTRSMNMAGGENPATTEGASSLDVALVERGTFDVNPGYEQLPTEGSKLELSVEEYENIYGSSLSTYGGSNGVALVTLERNEGEGGDFSKDMGASYANCNELSIYPDELEMLEYVCANFSAVVMIINASNTMELGFIKDGGSYTDKHTGKTYDFSNIKGALWVGGVGSTGCFAINDILCGDVCPSGHLPDTYVRDVMSTPAAINTGNYEYTNSGTSNGQSSYNSIDHFVIYKEGIYVGYRYYETACYEAQNGNYAGFDYDSQVIYPMGYGLSYTTFSMKYAETPVFDEDTNTFTCKVEITNTGSVAGKGLAQIYVSLPYVSGSGVEKAHVVLGGFAKTEKLAAGASETVEITINRDDLCSFDYKTDRCYILDAGDYNFYLSENAHSWASIDTADTDLCWTYTLDSKITYGENNPRPSDQEAAVTRYDERTNYKFSDTAEEGKSLNFSREDFAGTFPTEPSAAESIADDQTLADLAKYDARARTEDLTETVMPVTASTATKLQLIDLRGKDFDDELWDQYMQQFTVDSMYYMFRDGAWIEHADEANGVPESIDMDGPYGFFGHSFTLYVNVWYCSEPVLAATFNPTLARKVGDAFGEEAHTQSTPLTGWYGPGCNIHRNAFGGRNYEYYSEDPVLAGIICAAETSGASEKGLICLTKHFALNNQETNRKGVCTWANEQAIREVYVHSFEKYMKTATMEVKYYEVDEDNKLTLTSRTMSAATGIMTGYNRIGSVNCCHDTITVRDIVKNEFGFTGTCMTDCGGGNGTDDYMDCDHALRSEATDIMLSTCTAVDHTSATAVTRLQQACKRILFNKANANCMQGIVNGTTITYGEAPWQKGLKVGWGVVAVADVALLLLAGKSLKDEKERAKKKAEKKAAKNDVKIEVKEDK